MKMNRRDALGRLATTMGATLSAPTLLALLNACEGKKVEDGKPAEEFTTELKRLLAEVADTIIPATGTPGAKGAGVPAFIETMINDCYTADVRLAFLSGLQQVNQESQQAYGKSFVAASPEQRLELLKKLEVAAREEKQQNPKVGPQFFPIMKELTMLGYFTSEAGATQALAYVHIPGRYEGCVPLEPGQKAWS